MILYTKMEDMCLPFTGQAILEKAPEEESINGTGGLYYFPTPQGLSFHLHRVYGEPVSGNLESFKGVSGIMIPVNISNPQSCHALLWDGLGFHQVRGFIKRTNVSWIRFWQAPSGTLNKDCFLNLWKIQQYSFNSSNFNSFVYFTFIKQTSIYVSTCH